MQRAKYEVKKKCGLQLEEYNPDFLHTVTAIFQQIIFVGFV